ncbi:MAG: DnaA/Hda family protein [Parvibaculum sp.]
MTPAQLPLDLPHREALGREDFLIAEANQAAVTFVDKWPDWPTHAAVLVGPTGAGKTHLAHVWCAKSHARIAAASSLVEAAVPALAKAKFVLLENIDELPKSTEPALFHLINHVKEVGGHLLMTSRLAPAHLDVVLPDLGSRLRAAIVVEMGPPDDMLLSAILQKLFNDRQLVASEAVLAYLTAHMDRSVAAAQALVADVDRASLAGKRRITVPFVAEILRRDTSPS